jgi:hypothetical protein
MLGVPSMSTYSPDEPRYPKEKIIEALYRRLEVVRNIRAAKCKDEFDQGVNYMASMDVEWLEDLINDIERT